MGLMPHLLPRSPLPKLKGTDIIMQLFTSQHFVYLNLPINSKPMYYLLLLWKWFCSFSLIPLYICSFQATKLISELLLPKQYVQCNGSTENLINTFWNSSDLWYINKYNIEPQCNGSTENLIKPFWNGSNLWHINKYNIEPQCNGSTENLIRPFWNGSDLWYINKYNIEPPFQPLRILLSHSGMATIYEIPINVVLNIWTTLRLGHMCNALFFLLNSLHVLAGSCLPKLNGTNIIVQLFPGYYYAYGLPKLSYYLGAYVLSFVVMETNLLLYILAISSYLCTSLVFRHRLFYLQTHFSNQSIQKFKPTYLAVISAVDSQTAEYASSINLKVPQVA